MVDENLFDLLANDQAAEMSPADGEDEDEDEDEDDPSTWIDVNLPPSRPSWEDPAFINPLLVSHDVHERRFVERIIKVHNKFSNAIGRAKDDNDVEGAELHFDDAATLGRALTGTIRDLFDYRRAGAQIIDVLHGPKVGLKAKIEALQAPSDAIALLLERLHHIHDCFDDIADFFERNENSIKGKMGHEARLNLIHLRGYAVPADKLIARWRKLSVKARTEAGRPLSVATKLMTSGRQIYVVNGTGGGESLASGSAGNDVPSKQITH